MPEVWGDNAAQFDPYRWYRDDGEKATYSPFSKTHMVILRFLQHSTDFLTIEYHSWNAGPRSCIGRALATFEGIAITTAILQRFDITLVDSTKTYEPLAALNMVSESQRLKRIVVVYC